MVPYIAILRAERCYNPAIFNEDEDETEDFEEGEFMNSQVFFIKYWPLSQLTVVLFV